MKVAIKGSEQQGQHRPRESEEAEGAPEATRQRTDHAGSHQNLRGKVRLPQVGGDDCGQFLQRPPVSAPTRAC
eukprot:7679790-Pyramimonas_sp.AAC.1